MLFEAAGRNKVASVPATPEESVKAAVPMPVVGHNRVANGITREEVAKAEAETALTSSLRTLFAVAERYPELRANQNFLALQDELTKLEDAIQNARRYYNAVVRDLNTSIETFPGNLVAGSFGFARRDFFELGSDAERSAPKVSFGM